MNHSPVVFNKTKRTSSSSPLACRELTLSMKHPRSSSREVIKSGYMRWKRRENPNTFNRKVPYSKCTNDFKPDNSCKWNNMKERRFDIVLHSVGPHLQKKTTDFRRPISPEERLVITLR